jgi:LysR family hydrogen peroxide-inducible transcriptional activator
MTITQYEYIVAVDTYKSFGEAAKKCFVTQPTLSMQIQKMEQDLDVIIFDRSKKPVTSTETGALIIEQARRILEAHYRVAELIKDLKEEISGELHIGVIPTIAPYLLPEVLEKFLKKYPQVKVFIREAMTSEIISSLKNNTLDCGIAAVPVDDNSIKSDFLYYESFVAYVSRSSKSFKNRSTSLKDLADENILLLTEGHCMRNAVMNICSISGNKDSFNLHYEAGSLETLKSMVEREQGVTLMPELALRKLTNAQLNRVRYFKAPEPVREIGLIQHRSHLKMKLINLFKIEVLGTIPERMKREKKRLVYAANGETV